MTLGYHITAKSSNSNTGKMPVTTSEDSTCPECCPLMDNGCYAKTGPLSWHWKKVSNGTRGISFDAFCDEISKLPDDTIWRHNQAGDLPGDGVTINGADLKRLVSSNGGKRGFTYTHYDPISNKENSDAIAHANANGFTVNLSANSLCHADQLASLNIGPVTVVLDYSADVNTSTPAGREVVLCPYIISKIPCTKCKLCQNQDRPIIGFPATGANKLMASNVASGVIQ